MSDQQDADNPASLYEGIPPRAFAYHIEITKSDIDAQGHVNNGCYMRWLDEAAYAHSCSLGFDSDALRELGGTFVVRRHEVDYLQQAYLRDHLIDYTWPGEMKRFRALRHHVIVNEAKQQVIVRALTHWIYIDADTSRPKRMPRMLVDRFLPPKPSI